MVRQNKTTDYQLPTAKLPRLVAIVGPTASGKSALAMSVASHFNSEIICADSRTIYRGMDKGTAKPSIRERAKVPHWGLDLINPGQTYSAQQFKTYAQDKIKEIGGRNSLPIMVGGTGLYIDSLLYNYKFPSSKSVFRRQELEAQDVDTLKSQILSLGYSMPVNSMNKRHLIRTLERGGEQGTKQNLRPNTVLVGLMPGDEILKQNINTRAESMFQAGLVEEIKSLIQEYGLSALQKTGGIVYKICARLIDGEITEQTAMTLFKTADWQYARRQKTWFKKNNDIVWFTDKETALNYITQTSNT